ncbi:UvrD-helicase domain-containing protein [Sorangium sp. So ce1182]|uniref:UvrD-helicase domain-containing protein n=1 Tax=Sorangium sp. So ce1182 TaxID=3133334 RepID=UPI003F5F2A98
MNYVFTRKALESLLEKAPAEHWVPIPAKLDDESWGVASWSSDNTTFVISDGDSPGAQRIVIASQDPSTVAAVPQHAWKSMYQRVLRVAQADEAPPLRLPAKWSEYHEGNLVGFFASKESDGNLRWITEVGIGSSRDIVFWKLSNERTDLAKFYPPSEVYHGIISQWGEALAEVSKKLAERPRDRESISVQVSFDLARVGFRSITKGDTYSSWLKKLTPQQLQFVDAPIPHAVKLRGPAGSGKTLCLVLKALRETYRARNENRRVRILCSTHSWAVAEQLDAMMRDIDESGGTPEVDIVPLVELAKSAMPAERQAIGYRLLGEDSLSGKREQLTRIDAIVDSISRGDWLSFRRYASRSISERVESARHSIERNALVWDLMNEFSAVLAGHGILPGIAAEKRYLTLQRGAWMMPLENDTDKRFVLRVYDAYLRQLKEDHLLTSDQLINDFLNYLETFSWNLRRDVDGYDLIFVDELHLFGEQERQSLHYLTRSTAEYPRMVMALDPRQAPSEVYAEFPVATVAKAESGTADLELGEVSAFELKVVHRFSPQILALVQHVHRLYPALDLGENWSVEPDTLESSAPAGPRPVLFTHVDDVSEVSAVARRGAESEPDASSDRTAVVILDQLRLPAFVAALRQHKTRIVVIESRDDIDSLKYSRRSVVVGAAEYLAGLQFDRVIIAGAPPRSAATANQGHQRRRFLSLLYLAVSRATREVELHFSEEGGGLPDVVERAVSSGVVDNASLSRS